MTAYSSHGAEWVDRMRGRDVLEVASALGLEVQPPRGSSGGAFTCPACNAPRRHTKTRDKRASAGVRKDGHGWHCFQCDASGDTLDLVAFQLRGQRLPELGDAGKAEVRDWCTRWLGIDLHPTQHAFSAPPRPIRPAIADKPPSYPPAAEVEALWKIAAPVDRDPEVAAWLQTDRGLDPQQLAQLDLVRALPAEAPDLPRWAGFGGGDKPWRSWPSVGLRLLVPLHDAAGVQRSVLFRRSSQSARDWPPKSIGTSGYERARLVMANAVARHLLAHPVEQAAVSIVIEEGEIDWLTACLAWAPGNERAIFGVVTGSWTAEIAQRIPRGARVTIRTDNDPEGDKLCARIAESLGNRCTVLRGGRKAPAR
jgi:hypothetical protein